MNPANIVLVPATIIGSRLTARCEVLARRHTTIEAGKTPQFARTYSDCSIIGAPDDVPDGEYLIKFDRHLVHATCHGGLWLATGHPIREEHYYPLAG